jgi:hypothetical protein
VLLHRTNRSTNQASTQSLPGPLSCSSKAIKTLASPNPLDGGDIDSAVRWPWCWGSGAGGSCLAITGNVNDRSGRDSLYASIEPSQEDSAV